VFETFGEYANPPAMRIESEIRFIGADSCFPIVNSIAPSGDNFAWIEEVGRAKIEIDISDRLAGSS
jgi:hypothetical protein